MPTTTTIICKAPAAHVITYKLVKVILARATRHVYDKKLEGWLAPFPSFFGGRVWKVAKSRAIVLSRNIVLAETARKPSGLVHSKSVMSESSVW